MRVQTRTALLGLAGSLGLGCLTALAGTATYDFNSDPTGVLNIMGNAEWHPDGGVSGKAGDGYLTVTPAANTQIGAILFDDFDKGLVVAGFTFECDVRIGNGTARPADGFSIDYMRDTDPVLLALLAGDTIQSMNNTRSANGGQFSDNGNGGDYSLPEEGTQTGVSIGFDAWDSGDYTIPPGAPAVGRVAPGLTHDYPGLDIRVDNLLITNVQLPTLNGSCTDITSLQTGPQDANNPGSTDPLCWAHVKADMSTNGVLNVWYKNNLMLSNYQTAYFPSAGRLLFAGRTGGANENQEVDNVKITTYPATKFLIGAATATPIGVSIQVADSGPSKSDTNTIQLKLNDVAVTPTLVTKSGQTTTIGYEDASKPLLSGSTNKVSLTLKDLESPPNTASADRFPVTPTYTTIPANALVTGVDTSKKGFLVRTYLVDRPSQDLPNNNSRSERELHGDLGANMADLVAFTDNGYFDESGVINYNALPTPPEQGDFTSANSPYTDAQFPGTPGSAGSYATAGTDNFAAEILTYIQFPAQGVYTLIVNSDDGFRCYLGNGDAARDLLTSTTLFQFSGGRGQADSSVLLYVPSPGFYAFRTTYEQGGGGAELEWSAQYKGVFDLINGTNALALKAYRVRTGAKAPVVSYTAPLPGEGNVTPDRVISLDIADGTTQVDASSIKLTINTNAVTPTVTKSGSVTTVTYTPPALLTSGATYTVGISFKDNGSPATTYDHSWQFTVRSWAAIPPSLALPSSAVDTSKAGFLIKTVQLGITGDGSTNEIGLPNSTYNSEAVIHGLYGWTNLANLGSFTGPKGYYVEQNVINYNGVAGNIGDFPDPNAPDMPGIPGTATAESGIDNYVLEILTVLQFPKAGIYQMGVNSDDGFRVTVGHPNDGFRLVAGEYNGGRGASDTLFTFQITQPGLYPFRNLYEEGGGGNNVEWFMVTPNPSPSIVSRVLINDTGTDPTAIKAYQYPILTTKGSPYVKNFAPAPTGGSYSGAVPGSHYSSTVVTGMRPGPDTPIWAVLEDGETAITTSSVSMTLDGTAVTPTVTKTGTETTVKYQPAAQFAASSTHQVTLTFLDRTVSWSFDVGTIMTPTFEIEAADFNYDGGKTKAEASVMPYIGGAYAGLGAVSGTDFVGPNDADNPFYRYPNTLKVPVSFANDRDRGLGQVQVDFRIGWIGGGQWYNYTRTFPSNTYNVYAAISFDGTDPGQCNATLQMVDDPTKSSPTLTQLGIFDGPGTHALGGWGANAMVPLRDSNTNNLVALKLGGTQTLRYTPSSGDWDYMVFVPVGATPVRMTVAVSGANIDITWSDNTYKLQTATAVIGPWTDVTGAAPPKYTAAPTDKMRFYRLKK